MKPLATSRDFITVSEAAELAGVDRTTVWKWINAKALRRYQTPGKRTRVRRADVVRPGKQ